MENEDIALMAKEALTRIETHEMRCDERMKNIDKTFTRIGLVFDKSDASIKGIHTRINSLLVWLIVILVGVIGELLYLIYMHNN